MREPGRARPSVAVHVLVNLAAWTVRRRRRVRVAGESMNPTLVDGEFVLIDPRRRPQEGELVVARHPRPSATEGDLLVVKRVSRLVDDQRVELRSDNQAAGTDSRTWGPVDRRLIIGTVTVVLDRLFTADLGATSG